MRSAVPFLLLAFATTFLTACPEPRSSATAQVEDVWLAPGGADSLFVFSEQATPEWRAESDVPEVADVTPFAEAYDIDAAVLTFDVTANRIGDTEIRLFDESDEFVTTVTARVRAPDGMQLTQLCGGVVCTSGPRVRVLGGQAPRFLISYVVETGPDELRYVSGRGLVRMGNNGGSDARIGTDTAGDYVVLPATAGTNYRASLSAPPNAFFIADVQSIAAEDARLELTVWEQALGNSPRSFASASLTDRADNPVFFDTITWHIGTEVVARGSTFDYPYDPNADPTELTVTIGDVSTTALIHVAR